MMTPAKLPYSVSNFQDLITQGYHLVDKTNYIAQLEQLAEKYIFFLRPRRFGKSLFVSTLHYYYGIEHQDQFQTLFGDTYIGKQPTPLANSYLVLTFEFTKIPIDTLEITERGFVKRVKEGVEDFFIRYATLFSRSEQEKVCQQKTAADIIAALFLLVTRNAIDYKLYVMIDEYDKFANELLAFRLSDFKKMVSTHAEHGFVRHFYEAIKAGTWQGIVDRFFATGIMPVTLDSMTSGFNITTDLSLDRQFTAMLGFVKTEVETLMHVAIPQHIADYKTILPLMKSWYNGYRFSAKNDTLVYNPNMSLYFLSQYQRFGESPENMLDENIATDYSKIRRILTLKNPAGNYELLHIIVRDLKVRGRMATRFNMEGEFTQKHFLSLLFYLGFLTITFTPQQGLHFVVPNYVIRELYIQYFAELLVQKNQLEVSTAKAILALDEMTFEGNPTLLFGLVQDILKQLSNRDFQNFDEKYIKLLFLVLVLQQDTNFCLKSEQETTGGYIDLWFSKRPDKWTSHEYVLELKYLKKGEEKQRKIVQETAKKQLTNYIQQSDYLSNIKDLQAWTVVVVKDKVYTELI